MRIGIDVRCFAHGKNTGVEEYAKSLLKAIFVADSENKYVLFFNAWKNTEMDFSWATKYDNVTVKSYAIPNKLLNLSLWLLQYPKIDKLCGGLDFFFMPNSNFVALSHSTKLCLTVHDLSFEHCKSSFSLKRRLWHFFVNPRLLMEKAAHIFAVSEATREDIIATYGMSEKKVSIALNGPTAVHKALDRNNIELIVVKEKYHLPYNFILFFGTVEPRKNIIGLVEAYDAVRKECPDVTHKLVIAGASGWKSRNILRAISAAEYSHDIMLISDIPEEEKDALYTLASVFVFPSFFEGFGFPPLEAMMSSTPVVTSHTTSLPEVVGRHAIMIDPSRREEIAEAICAVIKKDGVSQHMVSAESMNHAQRFTWRRAADNIVAVFG